MIHFEWRLFMQLSKVMVTTKAWLYIFHHFHWVQCCYFSWNKISNEISYFFWFFFSLLFLIESEPISTSYTSVFRETCDDVIIENKRSHDGMINESIKSKKSFILVTSSTIIVFRKQRFVTRREHECNFWSHFIFFIMSSWYRLKKVPDVHARYYSLFILYIILNRVYIWYLCI